jgi:uridine monophosphate synthetase
MIYPRKEAKDYGTAKQIEGVFNAGDKILVIDDLITTGASKLEAIAPLEAAGLKVSDITVLVDREQGGKKELSEKGYSLHSVLSMSEMLKLLKDSKKISIEQFTDFKSYFANPAKWQEGK